MRIEHMWIYPTLFGALTLPLNSYCGVVTVSPGLSDPPAASVTSVLITGDTKFNHATDNEAISTCFSQVYVYGPINSQGKVPYVSWNSVYGITPVHGGYSCNGVDILDGMSITDRWEAIDRRLREGITTYLVSGVIHYTSDISRANTCLVGFRVGPHLASFNNGYARPSDCVVAAAVQPVVCTVNATLVLEHGTRQSGLVSSRQTGELNVNCSRRSGVRVSVNRTALKLVGPDTVESQFYVGADGLDSKYLTVDTHEEVPLISVINTSASTPGVYTGSQVVLVDWD